MKRWKEERQKERSAWRVKSRGEEQTDGEKERRKRGMRKSKYSKRKRGRDKIWGGEKG